MLYLKSGTPLRLFAAHLRQHVILIENAVLPAIVFPMESEVAMETHLQNPALLISIAAVVLASSSLLLFVYDRYRSNRDQQSRIRINVKYTPWTERTPSHLFVYLHNDGKTTIVVRTVRLQLAYPIERDGKRDRARPAAEAMSLILPVEDYVTPDLALAAPRVEPGQGGSLRYTFTPPDEEWLANHTVKGDVYLPAFIVVTTDTGDVWSSGVLLEPLYEGTV